MKQTKSYIFLIVVLFLSLWTIFPLIHLGFFPIHDNTQVQRVYEMGNSLADGMFPVRWVSDLGYGYGYPIFTFYAPLSYYVGGVLTFLMTSLLATKTMMAIGILFSGVTMYLFAQKLFGKSGGVVSAILYMYAPYHAVDIYVRGDVAEFWAYAFIPFAFYGFWKISENYSWKNILIASLGFAGIILSHNLTALMVTPFLLVFSLVSSLSSKSRLYAICYMLCAVILGLGISAFYTLPVFYEMKYTNVLSQIGVGANFRDHFVCLAQLWQSQWGYGGSTKGCIDGLSFMIGKIHIILSVVAVMLLPFLWKKDFKRGIIVALSIVSLLFTCFLMLPQSVFIWNTFSQMAFFQYPWRFLVLASFFSSFLGGSIFYFLQDKILGKIQILLTLFFVIFCLALYSKYFVPQSYTNVSNNWYISAQGLFSASKVSDEYMPLGFNKPLSFADAPKILLILRNGQFSILTNKTQQKRISVFLPKSQNIRVNIAYFPAWNALIDGKNTTIFKAPSGMSIFLPKGSHIVVFSYRQTIVELLGDLLSLTSAFIFILVIIWRKAGKSYATKSS